MSFNVVDIKEEVEKTVIKAGEILLSFFGNSLRTKDKYQRGFVTEADIASEQFLIERLSLILPEADFFAEESGKSAGNGDYCWVIDPLDGTTNFAHTIPYFCISVALTYKGEPILAIIYQPVLKELFYAAKGKGAFLNGKPIESSQATSLDKAFLGIGVPYEKNSDYYKRFMHDLIEIMKQSFSFRHFGAVALDLAYVACGRLDATFFEDLFWWDFSAGSLLIREANGVITDFDNNQINQTSRSVLGANKMIHKKLIALIQKV